MKKTFAFIFCAAAISIFSSCGTPGEQPLRPSDYRAPIRVACVGDSITYGYGIKDREHDSYPAQLNALLGKKWDVRNFGVNGATVFKEGSRPYTLQQAYRDALAFQPDVVILKLGTNDTAQKNWEAHKKNFISDYSDLVKSFLTLDSHPRVYICRPVPIFRDRGKEYDTGEILTKEIIPGINQVAKGAHLPIIDFYTPFAEKGGMFPDGVHPDANGTRVMAELIYAKLMGHPAAGRPSL